MERHSEGAHKTALAAAMESYAASGSDAARWPQAVEEGLYNLLYGYGGDGVFELSVARSGPTCVTVLGVVIWVGEQTFSPFEADFELDIAGAVKSLTLRAGDRRISRRDAPPHPQSWRQRLRIIASRPTVREDWAHVLHLEFD